MTITTSFCLITLTINLLISSSSHVNPSHINQKTETSSTASSDESQETADRNRHRLINLLHQRRMDDFAEAIKVMPELKERTRNGTFAHVMAYTIALNELELSKWLNENCADCNLKYSGHTVVDLMGRNYSGQSWQSMNAETFKYVYDNGGITSYLETEPERSIFVYVASHWIPEGDSAYGDYLVTDLDVRLEPERREQKLEMLRFLIGKNHNVNEVDKIENATAMGMAVFNGDESVANFLINNGAKVGIGPSPLARVSSYIKPAFLRKLLDFGYDPNVVAESVFASSSSNLLSRIVQRREYKPELLSILEEYQVNFNLRDNDGKTPIDYAYLEFDKDEKPYTDYLTSKGVKISNQYYYSAFKRSIDKNKHDIFTQLLTAHPHFVHGLKAEEKITSIFQYPIVRAAQKEHVDMVKALLDAGSPNNPTDEDGRSLIDLLEEDKNAEIVDVLKTYGK